ncbi:hypothetical protein [Streptosporangium sp. KLBMP 9127]|nr:hypothetical protein [Streptosporangium sp. KLBMP 9127]
MFIWVSGSRWAGPPFPSPRDKVNAILNVLPDAAWEAVLVRFLSVVCDR